MFGTRSMRAFVLTGMLVAVALGVLGIAHQRDGRMKDIASAIVPCNDLGPEVRFSCYRKGIEEERGGTSLKRFVGLIEKDKYLDFSDDDGSYAIFGTNCHTFYHALGDYIASTEQSTDIAQLTALCPSSCTSGCIMGLYKRIALNTGFATDTLRAMYTSCPSSSGHQCAHEVGHVLHDKWTTSVLKTVDAISEEEYGIPKSVAAYTTFATSNLNRPFEECKDLVPVDELAYCYTGIGHNLFLYSEFRAGDYLSVADECESVDAANKDACYEFLVYRIGINLGAPEFLVGNEKKGNDLCSEVARKIGRSGLLDHCYIGVGGGIGLYIDSQFSHRSVTAENLPSMREQVLRAIYMCDKSPEDYRDFCYKGLLGTPLKKLYQALNLKQEVIERILPTIDSDFEIVG